MSTFEKSYYCFQQITFKRSNVTNFTGGSSIVACEQVLCLGKKIAREGKGNGGFAFPPP